MRFTVNSVIPVSYLMIVTEIAGIAEIHIHHLNYTDTHLLFSLILTKERTDRERKIPIDLGVKRS